MVSYTILVILEHCLAGDLWIQISSCLRFVLSQDKCSKKAKKIEKYKESLCIEIPISP